MKQMHKISPPATDGLMKHIMHAGITCDFECSHSQVSVSNNVPLSVSCLL